MRRVPFCDRPSGIYHGAMLQASYRGYIILVQSRADLAPNVLVNMAQYAAAHLPTAGDPRDGEHRHASLSRQ